MQYKKEMETKIYKLKAITNLHVGSGDLSYGIVDKLVQRDSVTNFPTINASGIKGSLREYLQNNPDDSINSEENIKLVEEIFGSDSQPGNNKFFSAHLLTYPVRSNVKPFFRATCPAILSQLIESLKLFGINSTYITPLENLLEKCLTKFNDKTNYDFILFQEKIDNIVLEDFENQSNIKDFEFDNHLKQLFVDIKEFTVIRDSVFMKICSDLPVVARNNLNENEKNLWYEEHVPRQTEFWFFHIHYNKENITNPMETIMGNTKSVPVQIGANASVGEGYCKIEELFNNKAKIENKNEES